jgi:hypothetical protein
VSVTWGAALSSAPPRRVSETADVTCHPRRRHQPGAGLAASAEDRVPLPRQRERHRRPVTSSTARSSLCTTLTEVRAYSSPLFSTAATEVATASNQHAFTQPVR